MTADRPASNAAGVRWAAEDVAGGWQSGAAARGQALGPMTDLMLDLAGVGPGSRVLDLGAGTGDQTLVAARRVGPNGTILATDISASMLDLASAAARRAGLDNVQIRVMDAQQLDLASDSFDAVIARLSLQFVPDLRRALLEARRVLKPGHRLAGIVWAAPERNPHRARPQVIASRLAGRPFPEPGPGQWALADPDALGEALRQAGFRDVEVRPVPVTWQFPSLEDARKNLEEALPPLVKLMATLSDADRATAWAEIRTMLEEFVGPDGFEAPGEALVVVGTA